MASPIPLRVTAGPAVASGKRVPVDIEGLPANVATKAQIVALTNDTASTATDVATLLVDHNDLVSRYNALLAALKA